MWNRLIIIALVVSQFVMFLIFKHLYDKLLNELEQMREQRDEWRSQSRTAAETQKALDYQSMDEFLTAFVDLKFAILSFENRWGEMGRDKK